MQVSIWYVVALYLLGSFAVYSTLYAEDQEHKIGTVLASLLWPAITVCGIVIGTCIKLGIW